MNVPEEGSYRRVRSAREGSAEEGPSPSGVLPPSSGLSSVVADSLLAECGPNTLPLTQPSRWRLWLRCCLGGPTALAAWFLLLALAVLSQRWLSCVCVAAALLVGGTVTYSTVALLQRAAERIVAAQKLRPTAIALRDGRWQQMPPSQLVPGDLVRLHAGSVVPADCTIDGVLEVNEAALTGESLPVAMGPESMPKMGSIVVQGEARGTVQCTGASTFSGRLLQMLQAQQAQRLSAARVDKNAGLHNALTRVLFVTATAVAGVSMLVAGFALGYRKVSLAVALEGLVLVASASLPLGLEAAIAAAVAMGGWRLARRDRVLPVRLSSIGSMASMDVLYVDKTGTLTTNMLELQDECHLFGPDYTRGKLLLLAALALRWREPATDPLDGIILNAADLDACDAYTQLEYTPFSPSTCRTESTVRGPDGTVFKVTKGVTNAVLRLAHDRERWRPQVERVMADLGRRGLRCIMVAHTTMTDARATTQQQQPEPSGAAEPRWHLAGIITFLDPLRRDAAPALKRLEACGIAVKVITGDHPLITKEMVRRLGMGNTTVTTTHDAFPRHSTMSLSTHGMHPEQQQQQQDATLGESYGAVLHSLSTYAEARPQHKYLAVEVARQCGHTVGFLGDGINDAPAMQHAHVGIALMVEACTEGLGGGGDAAGCCCCGGDDDGGNGRAGLAIAEGEDGEGEGEEAERTALLAEAVSTPWVEGFASGAAAASWAHTLADAVALTPSLHNVVDAILQCRATVCVVESVLTFRLCCSLQMGLFFTASPFIALGDETLPTTSEGHRPLHLSPLLTAVLITSAALLAILAALDAPPPHQGLTRPHQWNVAAAMVAVVPVALVGTASSLLLQWILADSVNDVDGSWCHAVGIPPIPREFAAAALYLQVALSTTLAFLSCRARPTDFCWLRRPSVPVAVGVAATLAGATLLAAFLPAGDWEPSWDLFGPSHAESRFAYATGLARSPDGAVRKLLLWVWMWALWFWWVQELTRMAVAAVMRRLNVLHFRETQEGSRPPQPASREDSGLWLGQPDSGFSLGAFEAVEHRLLD